VVRIPRDFELPGDDAITRKDGQRLINEPELPRSLLALLVTLPTLDEEFPPIEDRRRSRSICNNGISARHLSDLVRRPRGRIADRIAEVGEQHVCTSIIVAAELRYGAAKKASSRLTAQLEAVLGAVEVLALEPPIWSRPATQSMQTTCS